MSAQRLRPTLTRHAYIRRNPDNFLCGILGISCFLSNVPALPSRHVCVRLLTQTESLDDSTIAIDVAVVQIVEQCAALSYQLCQ